MSSCLLYENEQREDLCREARRELREQLLEQASGIYQAEMPAQARERLCQYLGEQAPRAVATLLSFRPLSP
jgi:hypothetical protein